MKPKVGCRFTSLQFSEATAPLSSRLARLLLSSEIEILAIEVGVVKFVRRMQFTEEIDSSGTVTCKKALARTPAARRADEEWTLTYIASNDMCADPATFQKIVGVYINYRAVNNKRNETLDYT